MVKSLLNFSTSQFNLYRLKLDFNFINQYRSDEYNQLYQLLRGYALKYECMSQDAKTPKF